MSLATNEKKKALQQVRADLPVARFLHYREYLTGVYGYLKERIRPYSWIRFAEDFGFGANNSLRLIAKGQRPLTAKAAEKFGQAMGFAGSELKYWRELIRFNNARLAGDREQSLRRMLKIKGRLLPDALDESRLQYFSEWYHPVIRELASTPDFRMDPEWIQDRLVFPLRLEEIKKSMELLTRLGLIHYSGKPGRWISSSEQIDTGPDARGIAFIGYHQKMIELAKESISRVEKRQRELSGSTLCLSDAKVGELKKKIRELVRTAMAMEEEDGEERRTVVQFNIQLFPHTVEEKEGRYGAAKTKNK